MITLYQFPPAWGLPNASAFCMKVETYLRMAGLPYQFARGADIRKAPKGKFPVIEDNGKLIPDSGFIVDYLKATHGDPLDGRLAPAERAVALAMRRLMEEHLYWCVIYSRWGVAEHWAIVKAAFFAGLPAPLRWFVPNLVRKSQLKALYRQGIGRHAHDEIYALGKADITALADFLADKPFFMGEQPTSLDATAYAFLANILWQPIADPLQAHARSFANLGRYCERMKERYYA